MNNNESIVVGINSVTINNAKATEILKMKITPSDSLFDISKLDIIIKNTLNNSQTFTFNLSRPLKCVNGVSDEFIITNDEGNTSVQVVRHIDENNILYENPIIENLDYTPITLFEGENQIYTNIENANISISYLNDNNKALNIANTNSASSTDNSDNLYFKDAFTKDGDNINLSVNKITTNCISSSSNAFSLDSEGNLVVNSITSKIPVSGSTDIDYKTIFDKVYPVGAIYMSTKNTNPGTLFGGTWVAWGSGRVPVGVDTTQTEFTVVEKTGGSKTHTHTIAHTHTMAHTHSRGTLTAAVNFSSNDIKSRYSTDTSGDYAVVGWTPTSRMTGQGGVNNNFSTWQTEGVPVVGNTGAASTSTTSASSAANSGSTSTLPPYITCYMWKRTA